MFVSYSLRTLNRSQLGFLRVVRLLIKSKYSLLVPDFLISCFIISYAWNICIFKSLFLVFFNYKLISKLLFFPDGVSEPSRPFIADLPFFFGLHHLRTQEVSRALLNQGRLQHVELQSKVCKERVRIRRLEVLVDFPPKFQLLFIVGYFVSRCN